MKPPADPSVVDAFIEAALPARQAHREGGAEAALELLEKHPGIAAASIHAAAMAGELDEVRRHLDRDPGLAVRKGGPKDWEPLLYLSFSRFLRVDRERAGRMVTIADLLLRQGADPDAYWIDPEEAPGNRETPLYGAAGVANRPDLARLLIDAGADPNDGETPYHMVEHDGVPCAELIVPRLNELSRGIALAHQIDYDDLAGLRRLLELGCDPNGPNPFANQPLHQAVWRSRSLATFELLRDHGADLDAVNRDGKTAFALASRSGKAEIVDWLAAQGVSTELDPPDAFLSACAFGRLDEARAALTERPDLLETMADRDRAVLNETAAIGNTVGVATMLDVGWPVDQRGVVWKEAPTHRAAIEGRLDTVRLLVERGADLSLRDASYQSSPLGWAAHGGQEAVVRYLIGFPERIDLRDAVEFGLTERALALLADTPADAPVGGGEPGCLLRAAAYSGRVELVRALLERGADPSLRNSLGLTAADYARRQGHPEVAAMLAC